VSLTSVVFDLDGTLVDSVPGIERAALAAFAEIVPGVSLPPLRPLIGPPVREVLRAVVPDADDAAIDALAARFRFFYDAEGWRYSVAYPGCAEVLGSLRERGLRLFVATNKPLRPALAILESAGLAPLVDAVVAPDSILPPLESKADLLRLLVAREGMDPASSTMVGDTAQDAQAAAELGMAFVAALYGYGDLSAILADGRSAAIGSISGLESALAGPDGESVRDATGTM
jgi:phosphoglycolate phosphatase